MAAHRFNSSSSALKYAKKARQMGYKVSSPRRVGSQWVVYVNR